jgi:nitrite reductase/ring-hydroxylating ferredoxin subunit/uncharacterized membrane protein
MGTGLRGIRAGIDRIERATALDAVADRAQSLLDRLITGRVRDRLGGVWLGHPLHPTLVQVPVGAWVSATMLDIVPGTEPAATMLLGTGTAAAVPAAIAGWADWVTLTPEQRRVGLIHAATNAVAVVLQTVSLVERLRGRPRLGRRLSLAAITVAGAGAYLGGHLAFRQAAGVSHAAPEMRRVPDGWHPVADLEDLTPGTPAVRDFATVRILLIRDGDQVSAMIASCAHQGGPLGDGNIERLDGAECAVCPWHGSAFRISDGAVMRGPAATDQPVLRSRIRKGLVEIARP